MSTIKNRGKEDSKLGGEMWASLRGEADADAATDPDANEDVALEALLKDSRVSGTTGIAVG